MTELSFLGTDSGTNASGKGAGEGADGSWWGLGGGRGMGGLGVIDYINSDEVNRALGMYTF